VRASKRGVRDGVGRKALAATGISINALISIGGILVFGLRLKALASPAIKGSIAINGEPVRTAELFLEEKCDLNSVVPSDMSTYCARGAYRGEYLSPHGTFTYWATDPGEYALDVIIHPVPSGNCTNVTPGIRLHTSTSSVFAPEVLIVESDVLVQSGLAARAKIDIDLICE
jgi:hypothetical protein